jgi:tetratricopeptide (TPR) repeat protein
MVIGEYLQLLSKMINDNEINKPIFRGQNDDKYPVTSTAARRIKNTLGEDKEVKGILKQSRFIEYHNDLIAKARDNGYNISPKNSKELYDLEILAQVQHFGGATCLVDFTKNFMIALWFATNYKIESQGPNNPEQTNYQETNGKIYILDLDKESDLIGFITPKIIKEKSIEQILKIEITGEEYKTDPIHRQKFWIWKPERINNRIYSQDSIFVFGLSKFENKNADKPLYYELPILAEHKKEIRQELSRYFDINAETIFSDLHGFSNEANSPVQSAAFLENSKDCLSTSELFIRRNNLDLADSYLNQASNCIQENNSKCPRLVDNCQKTQKEKDEHLSNIAYDKARCCMADPNKFHKAIAFYREAFELNRTNYKACRQLIDCYYDIKNYNDALKYAEIYSEKDKAVIFDIIELLILNYDNQDNKVKLEKCISEIKESEDLYTGMGKVLIDFFTLVKEVIYDGNELNYYDEVKKLLSVHCDSYRPYWLYEDIKSWLLEKRVNAGASMNKKINSLLLIIERLEDWQKELVNKEYEKYDF